MKKSAISISILISASFLISGCTLRDAELARNVRTPGYEGIVVSEKLVEAKKAAETAKAEKEAREATGEPQEVQEEPVLSPEDNPEIPHDEESTATDYPEAYDKAVQKVKENMVLPDGSKMNFTGLPDIEDTDFCVMDIDSDGVMELMVRYAGSNITPPKEATPAEIEYMKSHDPEDAFIGIYEYKPKNHSFVCELFARRDSTFYENGVVISNNTDYKNLARFGKSYDVFLYNKDTGIYDRVGAVNTWDGFEHPEDYDKNPFPEEYDTDGDKIVYSISLGDKFEEGFIYDYDKVNAFEDSLKDGRISIYWAHR